MQHAHPVQCLWVNFQSFGDAHHALVVNIYGVCPDCFSSVLRPVSVRLAFREPLQYVPCLFRGLQTPLHIETPSKKRHSLCKSVWR